jgi:hypothetical protein
MKIPIRMALFVRGSCTLKSRGIGMEMIIKSDERLRAAFVMR